MPGLHRLGHAVGGVIPYRGRRGRRRWAVEYTHPVTGRRTRRADFRSRAEAAEFLNSKTAQAAPAMPFGQLVACFLRDYRPRSGRPDYYAQRARAWLASIPHSTKTVTAAEVEAFRRLRQAAGASPSTIRKDLTSLSTLYRWAIGRGIAQTNPASPALVRRPPKDRPDPRPLADDDLDRLFSACPGWLRPLVAFAVETGADLGEIVRLRWTEVDRRAAILRLPRSKTGVGRTIPYRQNTQIRTILDSAARRRSPDGSVFTRRAAKERRYDPLVLSSVKTAMRRAWASAGLGKRPWKSLRATFATRLAERNVPVPVIAELMGLSTVHVLEHYVRPTGLHLEQAMAGESRKNLRRVCGEFRSSRSGPSKKP